LPIIVRPCARLEPAGSSRGPAIADVKQQPKIYSGLPGSED
jgi:hypothetical protein